MLKKISEIFNTELKILRLRKQIRMLAMQGESSALVRIKEELLAQLQINLQHPFGFKDMKQLAIAELKKELQKVAHSSKTQRLQARKPSCSKKLVITEV